MRQSIWHLQIRFLMGCCLCPGAFAQTPLTWQQVKDKFEAGNPVLRAGQLNIQESKAQEVSAFLRPNPNFTASADQLLPFSGNPYRPLRAVLPAIAFNYLRERQHKRELRLESAQLGTSIAESQQLDLERTLLFTLRSAFVQTLQASALLAKAKENLEYYERELSIHRDRFKSGDIARVDLDRLVLQRVQYESDYQTAIVNARTAKITLLMLLNDRTPVDRFDVAGPFQFQDQIMPLGGVSHRGPGSQTRFEGSPASCREGPDRTQTGGCQWFHGSHLRVGPRASSPGLHRIQREHSFAHF